MKRIIIAIVCIAVCGALGMCGLHLYRAYKLSDIITDEAREDDRDRFMTGAYTGYRELTVEEAELFQDVYSSELQLAPRSVATQVVAGINYRFVCTDGNDGEYLVTIYKPLPNQGEARVTSVEKRN